MTDTEDDHPSLDGYSIDTDYCDVEKNRANVEITESNTNSNNSDESDESQKSDETDDCLDRGLVREQRQSANMGEGSAERLDNLIDQNAVIENDGRSQTNTFFRGNDAPDGNKQQYRRLAKYNDGMRAPDRKGQNRRADNRRWVDMFTSHLGMTDYHEDRVNTIVSDLDMRYMAHYTSEIVILSVCSLVANEDDRWIRDEDVFRDLLRDVDSDLHDVKICRRLVKRKSNVL